MPVAFAFVVPSKAKNNGRHQSGKSREYVEEELRSLFWSRPAWLGHLRRAVPPLSAEFSPLRVTIWALARAFGLARAKTGTIVDIREYRKPGEEYARGISDRLEDFQILLAISGLLDLDVTIVVSLPSGCYKYCTMVPERGGKKQPSAQQYRETKQQRSRSSVLQTRK